jgi:hypothetical protein
LEWAVTMTISDSAAIFFAVSRSWSSRWVWIRTAPARLRIPSIGYWRGLGIILNKYWVQLTVIR